MEGIKNEVVISLRIEIRLVEVECWVCRKFLPFFLPIQFNSIQFSVSVLVFTFVDNPLAFKRYRCMFNVAGDGKSNSLSAS